MPSFPRAELEEMIRRFVAANDEAGRTGDWSRMSSFYTEDALYTWNNGAGWEFAHVCVDDHTRLAYVEVLEDEKAHAESVEGGRHRLLGPDGPYDVVS